MLASLSFVLPFHHPATVSERSDALSRAGRAGRGLDELEDVGEGDAAALPDHGRRQLLLGLGGRLGLLNLARLAAKDASRARAVEARHEVVRRAAVLADEAPMPGAA